MVGYKKPTNKIVVAGTPLVQELKVETATNMYAGRLVKKGTNDDDVVIVAAATDPVIGWLGFEHTSPNYQPASPTTIYAQNDNAAVLSGGIVIVSQLASGQTCVKGDRLVMAAAGLLAKAAAMTATVPGSGTAVTSSSAQPAMTMAGSDPAGGMIVAIAEETQATSGGVVMVRSLI